MTKIDGRYVEKHAPDGWFNQYDADFFIPVVESIPENGVYVEIGVYKGRSLWTARFVAKPSVTVYGIDKIKNPCIEGTIFIRGDSSEITMVEKVDVLFIDGDHSYEGCKADIDNWLPQMADGGTIMFHDCDESSPGVVQAVEETLESIQYVSFVKSDNPRCGMAKITL